jgi:hypothetical protein
VGTAQKQAFGVPKTGVSVLPPRLIFKEWQRSPFSQSLLALHFFLQTLFSTQMDPNLQSAPVEHFSPGALPVSWRPSPPVEVQKKASISAAGYRGLGNFCS